MGFHAPADIFMVDSSTGSAFNRFFNILLVVESRYLMEELF